MPLGWFWMSRVSTPWAPARPCTSWYSCLLTNLRIFSEKPRTLNVAIEQYQTIKMGAKGETRNQLERAALSVCLNLSEGNAKFSVK